MAQETAPLARPAPPLFIVLSGPSGVGKDAVLNRLKTTESRIHFVTTLTTRLRRPAEQDGVDYCFVASAEFERLLNANELLEWANVYGNWYGVPKQPVREALRQGKDVMVKVDVQGAATIKKISPEAVFIFLMPPTVEELGNRLRQRYTEKPPELERRLQAAAGEMSRVSEFDYVVLNDRGGLKQAAAQIRAIITAEKCRVRVREVHLP